MLPALLAIAALLFLILGFLDLVRRDSLIRELLRQDDQRPPIQRVLDRLRR
ncbi:MAG: hypothetical protein HY701_01475 [Gemmatimonadetes bacterium]|nr:hypothetical protein [Gemmatimonadota bacterium]